MVYRLRMIAGPNGSGKSTLMELLKTSVNTGVYINPDEIEASLFKKPVLHLSDFGFETTQKNFVDFVIQKSTIGSAAFKKKNHTWCFDPKKYFLYKSSPDKLLCRLFTG
jgi:ABC-type lipoprotein export system ATPase subunit